MTEISPTATFDLLLSTEHLSTYSGETSLSETQSIVYLACLLSVYRGSPATTWGYDFISSSGEPFADALLDAWERLTASGDFVSDSASGRFSVSEQGRVTLGALARLSMFRDRQEYLRGAFSAADALPLPSLRAAVQRDPQLVLSASLALPQRLLDEVGLTSLHEDFSVLERELGQDVDLVVPAVVWLSFLLGQSDDPPAGET